MGRNRYNSRGVKHRFEHYIYIERERERERGWWRIFRRDIIWLQRGGTKREGREKIFEYRRVRASSKDRFFSPGKFIRRNATVAIFVLQISRDEMRGLNLCEKTINKYRVAPLTPASFWWIILLFLRVSFSFLFFYGRKESKIFFLIRSPKENLFYSRLKRNSPRFLWNKNYTNIRRWMIIRDRSRG